MHVSPCHRFPRLSKLQNFYAAIVNNPKVNEVIVINQEVVSEITENAEKAFFFFIFSV